MTSSLALFEAAIWVKSKHLITKNLFYINQYLKDCLDIEFTACSGKLMPQEVLTSFTVYDAYRYICASGIVIEVRK